jgi:hypothetical protein
MLGIKFLQAKLVNLMFLADRCHRIRIDLTLFETAGRVMRLEFAKIEVQLNLFGHPLFLVRLFFLLQMPFCKSNYAVLLV